MEDLINELIDNRTVNIAALKRSLGEFCDGQDYPPEQIAAMLVLLRCLGETSEQLAAFAETLLERALPINLPANAVSLAGTGGDHSGTFNISTAASLLTAACGVPVAKHGNRSVTSKCGSADVIEQLGLSTNLAPAAAEQCLKKYGFVFMFAPMYHPAFKYIAPVRKALKVRTLFNILGPLLTPGNLSRLLIGVFDRKLIDVVAGAALEMGHTRTMVVCSEDGLDEISLAGPSHAKIVENGKIVNKVINPEDYGFSLCSLEDLKGGDAEENAQIIRNILAGEKGNKSDCVVLNCAAGLYVSGKVEDLQDGVDLARSVQESGKGLILLENLMEVK